MTSKKVKLTFDENERVCVDSSSAGCCAPTIFPFMVQRQSLMLIFVVCVCVMLSLVTSADAVNSYAAGYNWQPGKKRSLDAEAPPVVTPGSGSHPSNTPLHFSSASSAVRILQYFLSNIPHFASNALLINKISPVSRFQWCFLFTSFTE